MRIGSVCTNNGTAAAVVASFVLSCVIFTTTSPGCQVRQHAGAEQLPLLTACCCVETGIGRGACGVPLHTCVVGVHPRGLVQHQNSCSAAHLHLSLLILLNPRPLVSTVRAATYTHMPPERINICACTLNTTPTQPPSVRLLLVCVGLAGHCVLLAGHCVL